MIFQRLIIFLYSILDFFRTLLSIDAYEKCQNNLDMFKNAYVNFTHWVTYEKQDGRVDPYSPDGLLDLFLHHAALTAYRNQPVFDLIIPIIFAPDEVHDEDFIVEKQNISFIMIQCRNWARDQSPKKYKTWVQKVQDMDMVHNIQRPYLAFWASVGIRSTETQSKKGFGSIECTAYNSKQEEVKIKSRKRTRTTLGQHINHVFIYMKGLGNLKIPVDCKDELENLLKNHDRVEYFKLARYLIKEEKPIATKPIAGGWLSKLKTSEDEMEDI
jgi:hypothetical protein